MDTPRPITILDTHVHPITSAQLNEWLASALNSNAQHVITTPNPEIILKAHKSAQYKEILNAANLNLPDGTGLQWASAYKQWMSRHWLKRLLSYAWLCVSAVRFTTSASFRTRAIQERVTGADTVHHLAQLAHTHKRRIFLQGSFVTQLAKAALEQQYGPIIAGTSELSPQEHDHAIQAINDSRADIVLVAYGAPTQEQWIHQHKDRMPNVRIFIGVGGALDMIAGATQRAPSKLRSRFEWLWRLFIQPTRIKRIFQAVIIFPLTMAWNALKRPEHL